MLKIVSGFLFRCIRCLMICLGITALCLSILAFTRIPFDVHRWLGEHNSAFRFIPSRIIMMGGSGMPSESNLIRLFYTSRVAEVYPEADIIIIHPIDSLVSNEMFRYLVLTGIDSSRIQKLLKGTNTREQVMELKSFAVGIENENVVVITSPENMYRTLGVFRKEGFINIGGISAFENAMFVDLGYSHRKIGGKSFVPDVSSNLDLRYNFWNYLKLEITCIREFVAIGYYRLNGWI